MFSGLFNNSLILLRGSSYGCRKRTCVRILHFIVIFYLRRALRLSSEEKRKKKKETKRMPGAKEIHFDMFQIGKNAVAPCVCMCVCGTLMRT